MNIPSTKLFIVREHRADIDFIKHLIIYLTIHSFEIQEISHYLNLICHKVYRVTAVRFLITPYIFISSRVLA